MTQAHYPMFKHIAQFNLSRNITTDEPPMLQSVNETITNALLPLIPLTDIESTLLWQLDPAHFNIQTPINIQALHLLTQTKTSSPAWHQHQPTDLANCLPQQRASKVKEQSDGQ
ncbi:7065_t:CDS:2, partial [Dentiscutata erythropus]